MQARDVPMSNLSQAQFACPCPAKALVVDSSYDPISVSTSPLMTWKLIYRDLDHAERFDWLYRDQMLWGSAGLAVGQANRPTSYARCLPGLRVDCHEITWGSEEEI